MTNVIFNNTFKDDFRFFLNKFKLLLLVLKKRCKFERGDILRI